MVGFTNFSGFAKKQIAGGGKHGVRCLGTRGKTQREWENDALLWNLN